MTGKEEDMLTNIEYIKRGVAIDRVVDSIIIDDNINSDALLTADKTAVVIAARSAAYSHNYKTQVTCPSCSSKTEFVFNLDNPKLYEGYAEDDETETSVKRNEDGTFIITVPFSKIEVKVKLTMGIDDKKIFKLVRPDKTKINPRLATETLRQIIDEVGGVSEEDMIQYFLENAPAADLAFLREKYKLLNPSVDLTQLFDCSECGYREEIEPPIGLDFFYPRN